MNRGVVVAAYHARDAPGRRSAERLDYRIRFLSHDCYSRYPLRLPICGIMTEYSLMYLQNVHAQTFRFLG